MPEDGVLSPRSSPAVVSRGPERGRLLRRPRPPAAVEPEVLLGHLADPRLELRVVGLDEPPLALAAREALGRHVAVHAELVAEQAPTPKGHREVDREPVAEPERRAG